MKMILRTVLCLAIMLSHITMFSQARTVLPAAESAPQVVLAGFAPKQSARYFQLTMVMRFPAAAGQTEPGEQSITTEVAVSPSRAGSCKTRMTSQVPIATRTPSQDSSKFIEVGTKLDCNDVHIEGDGLAFSIVLETSRVSGMIATGAKGQDGMAVEEPIITARNLSLSVRLPLDKPKIIFDSNTKGLKELRPLREGGPAPTKLDTPALQIEMVATELK